MSRRLDMEGDRTCTRRLLALALLGSLQSLFIAVAGQFACMRRSCVPSVPGFSSGRMVSACCCTQSVLMKTWCAAPIRLRPMRHVGTAVNGDNRYCLLTMTRQHLY